MGGTITHVAGQALTLDGRYLRQRCAWCGAVLLDYDLAHVMVPNEPDGSPGAGPAMWGEGNLIRLDGNMATIAYPPPDEPDVVGWRPDDACFAIDPAATA